jgi:hypothetical protein
MVRSLRTTHPGYRGRQSHGGARWKKKLLQVSALAPLTPWWYAYTEQQRLLGARESSGREPSSSSILLRSVQNSVADSRSNTTNFFQRYKMKGHTTCGIHDKNLSKISFKDIKMTEHIKLTLPFIIEDSSLSLHCRGK